MDLKCLGACGCDRYEGVTRADLDRYTDKIENVLNDENGRRLFRNYMITCRFKVGRRTLEVWERIDKLLTSKAEPGTSHFTQYLRDVAELMNDAERIDELDFALLERLSIAKQSMNKEQIVHMLKILRCETSKALSREYLAFRRHFVLQS